jgi:hypothetical protein
MRLALGSATRRDHDGSFPLRGTDGNDQRLPAADGDLLLCRCDLVLLLQRFRILGVQRNVRCHELKDQVRCKTAVSLIMSAVGIVELLLLPVHHPLKWKQTQAAGEDPPAG